MPVVMTRVISASGRGQCGSDCGSSHCSISDGCSAPFSSFRGGVHVLVMVTTSFSTVLAVASFR